MKMSYDLPFMISSAGSFPAALWTVGLLINYSTMNK